MEQQTKISVIFQEIYVLLQAFLCDYDDYDD